MKFTHARFIGSVLILLLCSAHLPEIAAQDAVPAESGQSSQLVVPEPPAELPPLADPAPPQSTPVPDTPSTPAPETSDTPATDASGKPASASPTPQPDEPAPSAPRPRKPSTPSGKSSTTTTEESSAPDGSKVKTTRKVISLKKKSALESMGTSLIFSADAGLVTAVPSANLVDYKAKTGIAVEAKALASILLNNVLIDAGLGWFFYNVSGTEPIFVNKKRLVDDDNNSVVDEIGIKLTGTILEASPSYRLGRSFFAGPTFQLRYPSDLGFDSQSPKSALGIYTGLQAGFQLFDKDLNTRFVGRAMVPVNYKDWAALHLLAGVQIGLPFTQPEVLTVQESTVKTTEKRVVEYRKQVFRFKMTRDVVKLVLDNLILFYPEPGYPTMTTESQSFLIDLSQSLATNESNWTSLQVDTVTKNHARVVRDAIFSAGVTDKKVRVGLVLQGNKAAANPPVEFTFKGVKNQSQLMDAVRRAMVQMSIPETCEGGVCQ